MARRTSTRGMCNFCQRNFGKASMTRHLKSCKERPGGTFSNSESAKSFHIRVEGRHAPDYWMHLGVPENAGLEKLDYFLRNTWLECCGHLSLFNIEGVEYGSHDVDVTEKDMGSTIGHLLCVGSKFSHEYDFGSTTELSLIVVEEGYMQGGNIRIMARNDAPALTCQTCGADATLVYAGWDAPGGPWFCDDCAVKAGLDEEMMLPVVNSPRVGTCAYTG